MTDYPIPAFPSQATGVHLPSGISVLDWVRIALELTLLLIGGALLVPLIMIVLGWFGLMPPLKFTLDVGKDVEHDDNGKPPAAPDHGA